MRTARRGQAGQVAPPNPAVTADESPLHVWLAAWAGCAALAVANGAVRQAVFAELGELRAHQLATGILLPVLGGYIYLMDRRYPLPDRRTALRIGGSWAAFTLVFEFGLGRLRGLSWSQMLADYDLSAGRVWVLVPIAMVIAAAIVERNRRRAPTPQAEGC